MQERKDVNQQINYTQEDRDRSIRTEADVKHVEVAVDVLKSETKELVEVSRNQAFTISGILESMKDAKAFMHEVGKHNERLSRVEQQLTKTAEADARLFEIEKKIDRVAFLGKILWAIVTTPAVLGVVILTLQYFKTGS